MDITPNDTILWPVKIGDDYVWPSTEWKETEDEIEEFQEGFDIREGIAKLWKLIKAIIAKIVDKLKGLIAFIGGLFKSRKKNKSADQILEELNVKPKTESFSYHSNYDSFFETKKTSVRKSDKSSDKVTEEEVGYGRKEITMRFSGNGDIIMDQNELEEAVNAKTKVVAQDSVQTIHAALAMIVNPKLIKKFANLIKDMGSELLFTQVQADLILMRFSEFTTTMNSQVKKLTRGRKKPISLKLQQIVEFSKQFADLSSQSQKIQDKFLNPKRSVNINNKVFAKLNNITSWVYNTLMYIQMSINKISIAVKYSDVIDKRYENTVSDINTLSNFVDRMIDNGTPPRYIAFNVFKVATNSIKGNGNADEPIWGQTRLVLFPLSNSHSVYKIAVNPLGRNSNNAEATYYSKVKNTQYSHYFAAVYGITNDDCIVEMERVQTKSGIEAYYQNQDAIDELVEVAKKITSELHVPDISGDIHFMNVGTRDGKPVCIDYGYLGKMVNAFPYIHRKGKLAQIKNVEKLAKDYGPTVGQMMLNGISDTGVTKAKAAAYRRLERKRK